MPCPAFLTSLIRTFLTACSLLPLGLSIASAQPAAPAPKAEPPPRLTPEQLIELVKAPPEFRVSLFATSDQVNYPVSVAAAPDGTLYVASDANSSLGTALGRGRIVRLRDTNEDGRADEVTQFASVDSPRGLVWDRDRLYVMHPPHLSVFFDRDGDGVSEESQILVRNIAFAFRDRPADHSSNGVTLGIDGWLYLAIGDFGFMAAEGTDGRHLQLRGGGVVRVRPDGTGLELFARGTRNILEVALSPRLDGIARDNTNDGDGWDVRLHHLTAFAEHGYPSLYKNFAEEIIAPLADYGAGSGCGSLWLDEPGIPAAWNRAPITVDWGRETIYRHGLTPNGATFTATQEEFIKLPRPTDLDVDALSSLYVASWRGGQYNYSSDDVGFIVRLDPLDYQADPLPNLAELSNLQLVELFHEPSHRLRLAAQRALLRRDHANAIAALENLAGDATCSLETRILALFTLKQARGAASHSYLAGLAGDPDLEAWAIRALTDHEGQLDNVPARPLLLGMESPNARVRHEAAVALGRLGRSEHARALASLLGDTDPVVAHTVVEALIRLRAADASLAVVDDARASAAARAGALQFVQSLHELPVVDALLARLERESEPGRRLGLLRALSRLHFVEGTWSGDSWGTRPDTRGPYYQPERWAGSARINAALEAELQRADATQIASLNELFALHRVTPGDPVGRLLTLAATDDALLTALAQQLAVADAIPPDALPLLARALTWEPAEPPVDPGAPALRGQARRPDGGPTKLAAMQALVKAGTPDAMKLVLATLPELPNRGRLGDGVRDKSANALFISPQLENHAQWLAEEAAKLDGERSAWADAALLHLANRRLGAPEPRDFAQRVLDEGWTQPARRAQIIRAAALGRETSRSSAFVAALDDPDSAVSAAARDTIAALRIDVEQERAHAARRDPVIATLATEDVLARVMQIPGLARRGELIYNQVDCATCHTVNAADPLKGPYLGTVASMFPRRELAEAILDPNKTIAQGFVTYQFTLKNGDTRLGFVVREAAGNVVIRDITGQEHTLVADDVARRERLPISLMPAGLMNNTTVEDFASMLAYLEALSKRP